MSNKDKPAHMHRNVTENENPPATAHHKNVQKLIDASRNPQNDVPDRSGAGNSDAPFGPYANTHGKK
jgi:hypothetical protein